MWNTNIFFLPLLKLVVKKLLELSYILEKKNMFVFHVVFL